MEESIKRCFFHSKTIKRWIKCQEQEIGYRGTNALEMARSSAREDNLHANEVECDVHVGYLLVN